MVILVLVGLGLLGFVLFLLIEKIIPIVIIFFIAVFIYGFIKMVIEDRDERMKKQNDFEL